MTIDYLALIEKARMNLTGEQTIDAILGLVSELTPDDATILGERLAAISKDLDDMSAGAACNIFDAMARLVDE